VQHHDPRDCHDGCGPGKHAIASTSSFVSAREMIRAISEQP
jgi:hypothetical protein